MGNIDWKPPLLEAVVEAVKKTQSKEGTPQFEKARMRLAAMNGEKTVLGKLTVEQVKYGWGRMKDNEGQGQGVGSQARPASHPFRWDYGSCDGIYRLAA